MIKLDIFSDPVCPWCYIGKANLEKALREAGDHPFVIEFHPFELNPGLPVGGVDLESYFTERMGSAEAVAKAQQAVAERAREAGLEIVRKPGAVLPNTFDAHRLIHWAGQDGKQMAMVDALFKANFVDGLNIGDHEVLADLAASIGMERAPILRLLQSDADCENIEDRLDHSRRMGVRSVPTFIVGNRHAVQGAQPAELWAKVIAELIEKQAGEKQE